MTRAALAAFVVLTAVAGAAGAQGFPSRPIRLIVPYIPGGANDNVARPLAQKLTDALGRAVVVDNRGGGGSMIGASVAAKAPPDGHTLLLCSIATHAISPNLYKSVPYDPFRDFAPITLLVTAPILLVASEKSPFETVKDLVAYAKANPGKLTYASGGSGSSSHLAAELLKSLTGTDMLHVPFKGGGDAVTALFAGRVDVQLPSAAAYLGHVKAGRLKGLAIARTSRWPDLANVPTFAEAGFPQYESDNWWGLCAPAGTPRPILDRLYQETVKALQSPDLKKAFYNIVADAAETTPQQFQDFLRSEYDKYGRIIRQLNMQVDQ